MKFPDFGYLAILPPVPCWATRRMRDRDILQKNMFTHRYRWLPPVAKPEDFSFYPEEWIG